jgi:hypothetical protein
MGHQTHAAQDTNRKNLKRETRRVIECSTLAETTEEASCVVISKPGQTLAGLLGLRAGP